MTPQRLDGIKRHIARMRAIDEPLVSGSIGDAFWNEDVPALIALAEAAIDRQEAEALGRHGGQGRGLSRKNAEGAHLCGRCGRPYGGASRHGPGWCGRDKQFAHDYSMGMTPDE